VFLLVPAHPGSPRQRAIKQLLLLVLLFTFNINVTNMTVCSDKTLFNKDCVTQLEHWIDEYQQQLPPLKNFILPVCFQTQFHMLAVCYVLYACVLRK